MGSFQERYNDPNMCLVRLRSLGTERIFDQLKNLTGQLSSTGTGPFDIFARSTPNLEGIGV